MKGLDTNVLVRYLTQDDKEQAAIATREIQEAAANGEKLFIQPLVLCELVWVLETAYGFAKPDILKTLEAIMRTAQFEIGEKNIAWQAIGDFKHGKGDFAHYYLGRANEKEGCRITLTFDKVLKGNPRLQVPSP